MDNTLKKSNLALSACLAFIIQNYGKSERGVCVWCGSSGGNQSLRFVQPESNTYTVHKPAKTLPVAFISRSPFQDLVFEASDSTFL